MNWAEQITSVTLPCGPKLPSPSTYVLLRREIKFHSHVKRPVKTILLLPLPGIIRFINYQKLLSQKYQLNVQSIRYTTETGNNN
jgi:hypothetical protein